MTAGSWMTAIGGLLLITTGCMTDATVELTKAPFDATSQLTNGTTDALKEFLDPTTDFTSSTTPGAEAGSGLARAKKRLELFTAYAYENIRMDVSRGGGEYLVSLASLAGVSSSGLGEFRSMMQEEYRSMFDEHIPVKDSAARIVEVAWAKGYGAGPVEP